MDQSLSSDLLPVQEAVNPEAIDEAPPAPRSFLDRLFDRGLLIRTGVDGLYGRSGAFESVVEALDRLVSRVGAADGAEALRFPPGMARSSFERSGYLKGFPHLAGTVHSFCGNEADHARLLACLDAGEDWTAKQAATDIVLTPAACYPLYPVAAARGRLPEGGLLFDLQSYCFRHEPSLEPTRMQLFRMREYVRMGTLEQVLFGPSVVPDGTMNLMGALRRAMATTGYTDLKEFQRIEVVVG